MIKCIALTRQLLLFLCIDRHDHDAEESFSKLHRTRNSQVTVSAVCGCGRSVEGKKQFEKVHYSNTTERKLRSILAAIRLQLKDNIALCQARASEAVSALRFSLELTSDTILTDEKERKHISKRKTTKTSIFEKIFIFMRHVHS